MKVIGEVMVALLAAGGLLTICWLLFGRLLIPVGNDDRAPVYAVIPASGSGDGLEYAVDGLLWLRGADLMCISIVVVDDGLNECGIAAAQALQRREPGLIFCPLRGLEHYIKETTQNGFT
jgi:hypothetical protein